MDRRQLFNKDQLLELSGLTPNQFRKLQQHGLLEINPYVGYLLTEVIYCRLVFLLRKQFSLQQLKKFIKSHNFYGEKLLNTNYALLISSWDYPMELSFHNDLIEEEQTDEQKFIIQDIKNRLASCYFYQVVTEYQRFDQPDLFKISRLYVNLKLIREQLKEKAKAYDVDFLETKFQDVA